MGVLARIQRLESWVANRSKKKIKIKIKLKIKIKFIARRISGNGPSTSRRSTSSPTTSRSRSPLQFPPPTTARTTRSSTAGGTTPTKCNACIETNGSTFAAGGRISFEAGGIYQIFETKVPPRYRENSRHNPFFPKWIRALIFYSFYSFFYFNLI